MTGPVLRVVSGSPSPEELAALTAIVTAAGSRADPPGTPRRGRWNDPAVLVRHPVRQGPGAWQAALR